MRWTEAGLAVALGFENYWLFTMTGPLGHLGRYADCQSQTLDSVMDEFDFLRSCSHDDFTATKQSFSNVSEPECMRLVCLRRDEDAVQIARDLIEMGHDANGVQITSHLVAACDVRSLDMVECLLANGADPNLVVAAKPEMRGVSHETAMHAAIHDYSAKTYELLLKFGGDNRIADQDNPQSFRNLVENAKNYKILKLIDDPEMAIANSGARMEMDEFVSTVDADLSELIPSYDSSIETCRNKIGVSSLYGLESIWKCTKSLNRLCYFDYETGLVETAIKCTDRIRIVFAQTMRK